MWPTLEQGRTGGKRKETKFKIFTCNHDDPSWCGDECSKIISETEWLDIVWKGKITQINGKGKLREKKKQT